MRIAKKATKGKGKTWRRGQSSSCNPETKKFREKARSFVIQENRTKSSQLTVGAVETHNILQLEKFSLDDDDSKSETATFASLWSNCTNVSFEKLLSKWQPSSLLHREMLAVLATAAEIIKEKGGKETETEYFAILITCLNGVNSTEALTATLCLLNLVVKRLPQGVLKAQFSETSEILRSYLKQYVDSENGALMRSLISCLAVFLRAQEAAVWSLNSTQQTFVELLSLTTHQKPRVRKAAHKAVVGVLKGSTIVINHTVAVHPAATIAADYCVRTIEERRLGESLSVVLHMINLLKDILPLLPSKHLKSSCEAVLSTMSLQNMLIFNCSLQVFHELFTKAHESQCMTSDLNTKLILALFEFQPSVNDAQPMSAWLVVMKKAYVSLFSIDRGLSHLKLINKLFQVASSCWSSETATVHSAIEDCLITTVQECFKPLVEDLSDEAVGQIISILQERLSYKYMNAWGSLFKVLAAVFEVFGVKHAATFSDLLKSLGEVRDSERFQFYGELDFVVRQAVKSMGPRFVLQCIPMKFNPESVCLTNAWLLPVLREGVTDSEITFFFEVFVPLAKKLDVSMKLLEANGDMVRSKVLSFQKLSIWELLVAFFTNPVDAVNSFKSIARQLGEILQNDNEVRPIVLKALRMLIKSGNEETKAEVAKYSKNFLPVLLKLYTSSSSLKQEESLSVLETLKSYLSITTKEVFQEQYGNLQKNLQAVFAPKDETTLKRKHALLDIVCTFVPYLSEDLLEKVFKEYILTCVAESSDKKSQKKAFKILETLVRTSNNNAFVAELLQYLKISIPHLMSSIRYAALRSLKYIIENNLIKNEEEKNQTLKWAVTESVRSLTINSAKTKKAAEELLVCVAQNMESISTAINSIVNDFKDHDEETKAASIHALSVLLTALKTSITREDKVELIQFIVQCLQTDSRARIKSVIIFFKRWLSSLSKDESMSFVGVIISALTSLPENEKHHFRFKIKEILTTLVRKFGFETISKFSPDSYSKILRSIRKIEARKAKLKASEEDGNNERTDKGAMDLHDSSDEEELEVVDKPERSQRKKKRRLETFIAENTQDDNVVDLLSNEANRKIFSMMPMANDGAKNDDFEIADDGRIVIDFEDVKSKGKKRKRDEEEEDDNNDNDNNMPDTPMEETIATVKPETNSKQYRPGGRGIHRKTNCVEEHDNFGAEYRSNKARGDMKRKGKPDPYAYVPLNRQSLSKKKQAKFRGQFRNIVSAARKGAATGNKQRNKARK